MCVIANVAFGSRDSGLYMNPKYPACTTTQPLSNTSLTCLIVVHCTPDSFPPHTHTMALTEFQNKCIDVKQTECRFGNALRLNDFLTLMLQEVSDGALSHRALGLPVPPFSLRVYRAHLAAGGPRSVTCCCVSTPLSRGICGKQAD